MLNDNEILWTVDESLRGLAATCIEQNEIRLGHIELDKILFGRVFGHKGKWLGKIYYLGKPPVSLLAEDTVLALQRLGYLAGVDHELLKEQLDFRYKIVLNDDKIRNVDNALIATIEKIVLTHELGHIDADMEGLVKHDLEEFKFIADSYGTHWNEGRVKGVDELDLEESE